jgi:para-aminobenzoate synthetase component I
MVAREREQVSWASRAIAAPRSLTALRHATAATPGGVMLESAAVTGAGGRYSIFATHPARLLTLDDTSEVSPFELLVQSCRPWCRLELPPELPFAGGWIGYLAYEAGRSVEPSAGWRHHDDLPACQWGLYDTAVLHDAASEEWHVVGVELTERLGGSERPPLAERLKAMEELVSTPHSTVAACAPARDRERHPSDTRGFASWNFSRDEYLAKVRRVLEYIRAGDIFQVNLTRRMY